MTFYDKVKNLLDHKGLTLEYLSEKTGISVSGMYKWKNQSPNGDNIKKVANILDVSTDYLLDNSESSELTKQQLTLAMSVDPDITDEQLQQAINYVRFTKEQEDKKNDTNGKN